MSQKTEHHSLRKRKLDFKWIAITFVVVVIAYIIQIQPQPIPVNSSAKHVEITKEGNLLDSTGRLIDVGYATRPLKVLNEEDIRPFLGSKYLNRLRYKKWDFFDATSDDAQLLIHFADLGYVANVQILVYMHQSKELLQISDNIYNLTRMATLPRNSNRFEGEYSYKSDSMNIQVKYTPASGINNKHQVHIRFNSTLFSGDVTYFKHVHHDEIVMLTPLTEDHRNFYYNTKTYCMEVKGRVDFVHKAIKPLLFNPQSTAGGRDIGRGVWNYMTYWFWAFGSGFIIDIDGLRKNFGINLGNGFEMQNSMTYEDSIFVGGKMNKLHVVKKTINTQDLSIPWILQTDSKNTPGSFNAQFFPIVTNVKRENKIIIDINFQQFFGYFSGYFVNNLGHQIDFKKIYGFCEVQKAKW